MKAFLNNKSFREVHLLLCIPISAVPLRSSRHLISVAGPLGSIFPASQKEEHELEGWEELAWDLGAPCHAGARAGNRSPCLSAPCPCPTVMVPKTQ